MEVIDSQVHIWKKDSPDHPWDPTYGTGGPSAAAHRAKSMEHTVSYEDTTKAMDDAGVDAAVIVTTILYGWDNAYSLEAVRKHPDRFTVMGRVEPLAPGVEERVAQWKAIPGAVGIRVVVTTDGQREQVTSGALDPFFTAAERQDVPVAIFAPRFLPELEPIARKHPDLALHLDHVGLPQPPLMPADPDPFLRLPSLLALAKYPRVAVKLSAAPTLSLQKFPFADLWPSVHQIIAAYGPERVMWGSDWTRALPVVSYSDQVRAFTETNELGAKEKELIMGKSLRTLLRWPRAQDAVTQAASR
jgi:L-fuconolactonase